MQKDRGRAAAGTVGHLCEGSGLCREHMGELPGVWCRPSPLFSQPVFREDLISVLVGMEKAAGWLGGYGARRMGGLARPQNWESALGVSVLRGKHCKREKARKLK